jgi:hypothetical protein
LNFEGSQDEMENKKMLIRILQYLERYGVEKVPLGRWGYHWESRLKYQKYYD